MHALLNPNPKGNSGPGMSRADQADTDSIEDVDNPASALYRPPAQKSVKEILDADPEDESLKRYKEMLLGQAATNVIVDQADDRVVILKTISLLSEGRPDIVLDVGNNKNLEDICFRVKEGVHYRIRFMFHVQREMVTGLRYSHKVTKMGVTVISEHLMVGSYAPRAELIEYITPLEEAPSGMLARGKYKVNSKLTDDYKNVFAKWQWVLEIAKDW